METQLSGDEGRVGEWAWSHLAGIGVGGWNSSSGCRRFPVFWQEGMDLVCGEAAVGEFLQAVAEIEADVEIGALGAGEHGHDGGDGRAAFLGAQMHPVLTAEGDRAHTIFTPIVVDFNQAIGSENAEAFPLIEQVVAGRGEQAGRQGLLADLDDPLGKGVELGGHAAFLAQLKAGRSVKLSISGLALHCIKFGDQIEHLLALLLQNRHPGFVGLDELSFFEPLTS